MTAWILSVLWVVAFVGLLNKFKLVGRSKEVFQLSQKSFAIIKSTGTSDAEKEKALQKNALLLFRSFFQILLSAGGALFIPFLIIWLLSKSGLVQLEGIYRVTLSPAFIIGSSLAMIGVFFFGPKESRATSQYSFLDRVLHRLAFSTYSTQIPVADMETNFYKAGLGQACHDNPVFITSLPRAGTTLLLECCARLPDFASHCYRDMPFVLTPCFWQNFSGRFQQKATEELRERAHGDGLLINLDSPEALEEVVWKTFWKKQYVSDRIPLWPSQPHPEFLAFFQEHMRKIIFLRKGAEGCAGVRYLSKNNMNIARIKWIQTHIPDATILVPFRDPVQHAASLLRQHNNFTQIQKEDPFASRYMRSIGHFDFGLNLKPIDFDHWLDGRTEPDPLKLGFWLEYWLATYRALLEGDKGGLRFFDFVDFCTHPESGLQKLGVLCDTKYPEVLQAKASSVRVPTSHAVASEQVPDSLLADVQEVYELLKTKAKTP